jgi:hypothetical protein
LRISRRITVRPAGGRHQILANIAQVQAMTKSNNRRPRDVALTIEVRRQAFLSQGDL